MNATQMILDPSEHIMELVRQNEVEDIYICSCGAVERVPRDCDTPECPMTEPDHDLSYDAWRDAQAEGSQ